MLKRDHNGMDAIDHITEIRKNNNRLWMQILRLAFDAERKKARAIMKKIQENDKEVTEWLGKL